MMLNVKKLKDLIENLPDDADVDFLDKDGHFSVDEEFVQIVEDEGSTPFLRINLKFS